MDKKNNILKQAKHDIFMSLDGIIKSYIMKGASYKALKKYYKKNKNFEEILEDIRNKGVNFFNTDKEYKAFVKKILMELFDDRISYEKDKKKVTEMKKPLKKFGDFINEKKKASPAQIEARKKFADMVASKKKDSEPEKETEKCDDCDDKSCSCNTETKKEVKKETKKETKKDDKKETKKDVKKVSKKKSKIQDFGGFKP